MTTMRKGTDVHAVSEDAEPLDPLQEERDGAHLDEETTEDHHADPDECGEHGADGVLARRRAEHQCHAAARDARQHDVQHVERKLTRRRLETCCTTRHRCSQANTHTHTHPFNGPSSGTTRVGRYQKGKTTLDFTEARDGEWQWHQLSHMQVCTSLQTDNHARTPPLSFYRPDALPAAQPTASKH